MTPGATNRAVKVYLAGERALPDAICQDLSDNRLFLTQQAPGRPIHLECSGFWKPFADGFSRA